ncbi:unknown [Firmicutes bacterium CAG:114]|nr:unknown [Firmicutes bacterium CAG:114]
MAGPSQGEPRYPQKQDQVEQEGSGSVLPQSTQYLPPVQRQGIDQEKEQNQGEQALPRPPVEGAEDQCLGMGVRVHLPGGRVPGTVDVKGPPFGHVFPSIGSIQAAGLLGGPQPRLRAEGVCVHGRGQSVADHLGRGRGKGSGAAKTAHLLQPPATAGHLLQPALHGFQVIGLAGNPSAGFCFCRHGTLLSVGAAACGLRQGHGWGWGLSPGSPAGGWQGAEAAGRRPGRFATAPILERRPALLAP